MNRKKLEALAWKHTHRDFKDKRSDGTRVVLRNMGALGTCSVELSSLTDAELTAKIPAHVRAEVGL